MIITLSMSVLFGMSRGPVRLAPAGSVRGFAFRCQIREVLQIVVVIVSASPCSRAKLYLPKMPVALPYLHRDFLATQENRGSSGGFESTSATPPRFLFPA